MQINGPLKRAQFEELASDPVGVELVVGRLWKITSQNVFKVYDGAAVRTFADLNSAQTFQNKTLNEATFTQIATPSNPAAGFSKLYPKTDGKFYTLDSAGNEAAVGSGSGGGVDNLIVNGSADDTASSIFVPYADAAGTRPVDGTGGSPTVTTAITTTNPLNKTKSFTLVKPASNVQGQGWAVPFSVPLAYRAKSLKISTKYIVDSGTFVPGSPGVDGDVIVYLYDITNSQLIEPSNIKLLSNSSSFSDQYEATFQTSPTGADYRLIFHVASVSALAYTLKVDDVTVSPQNYVYGTPITDWQSFTPTGSWNTNTTYAGRWRRVGDSLNLNARALFSGAPNSATFTLNLPSGLSIDTSKLSSTTNNIVPVGRWDAEVGGIPYTGEIVVNIVASNTLLLRFQDSLLGRTANVTQASPISWASGNEIVMSINTLPIVGWSSSVQMSDAADTRVIAARMDGNPTSALTNTFTNISGGSAGLDTHGALTPSTGTYVAPASGFYQATFNAEIARTSGTATQVFGVRINNATKAISVPLGGGNFVSAGSESLRASGGNIIYADAGDILRFQSWVAGGVGLAWSATLLGNSFSIQRISGPSAIAASESVNARGESAAGQSMGTGVFTKLQAPIKQFDTHNALQANGDFVCPVAGKYLVTGVVTFVPNAVGRKGMAISKNGA